MEFQDELAGGTVLVRPALQSPDYVTGVSGWAIKIDGSAEFNNVVIRGGTTVGGTALYYNGTPAVGNLIVSIAGSAGSDSFGNAYVQGLGVYGTDGDIQALGNTLTVTGNNGSMIELFTGSAAGQASIDLRPKDLSGTTWTAGSVYTQLAASNRAAIVLESPTDSANFAVSSIMLQGGGPTTTDTAILFGADRLSVNNDLDVFGILTAANRVVGSVLITPSAANTPTSATVNYGPLTGSTFRGVASTESTVPGTQVTGWAVSSITSTSALVWVTRTNTTATRVDYIIEGF